MDTGKHFVFSKFRNWKFVLLVLFVFVLVNSIIFPLFSNKKMEEISENRIVSQINTKEQEKEVEMDDDFKSILKETENFKVLRNIIKCLQNTAASPSPNIHIPQNMKDIEKMEKHYQFLQKKFSKYFFIPDENRNRYYGYNGPWIEHYWRNSFMNHSLSYFGYVIPLFIQWNDIFRGRPVRYERLKDSKIWYDKMYPYLNENYAYVTVTQNAGGLEVSHWSPNTTRNILKISSGGYGHIPIPLLMKRMYYQNGLENEYLVTFLGNIGLPTVRVGRKKMKEDLIELQRKYNFSMLIDQGGNWKDKYRRSVYCLAPRGFGRTSFRLFEIIQMGHIPVYLWDDLPWIPYQGSSASVENFGYVVRLNEMEPFIKEIILENEEEREKRIKEMKKYVESHYTYEGIVDQIDLFIKGDSKSDLKCQKHPLEYRYGEKDYFKKDNSKKEFVKKYEYNLKSFILNPS